MNDHDTILPPLKALDHDATARILMASVPLPRDTDAAIAFAGMRSQAVPLAYYPGSDGPGAPRQVLLLGIRDGLAPSRATLATGGVLVPHAPGPPVSPTDEWQGPRLDVEIVSRKKTGLVMREVNELSVAANGREIGLRMGLRHENAWRWWQFVRLEQLWAGPVCRAYRAAGYIGVEEVDDEFFVEAIKTNTGHWLHRHNWLLGELYLLVFANGLVRITARHLNNRMVDKGQELTDVLPVLGLHLPGEAVQAMTLDGSQRDIDLGGIQLDLARSADLHGPEHPGYLHAEEGFAILQPYTGVEMSFGEYKPPELHQLRSDERRIWSGIARSFGFDLSFADAPIRTQRYLPPLGWIAHCGTLWPDGALAARGRLDRWIEAYREPTAKLYDGLVSHRFYQKSAFWDGEFAHALMLHAYRAGDGDFYRAALHHAYALADIGIDHTDFSIRIWYQRLHSTGPVLCRNLGMLAAYLEEGDPYLLRMAESLAEAAYLLDRSNWPRRTFGRDAAYIRSLTRLYDVTGESHYLRRAGEACRRVAQCQRADGSHADQGGTAEAHGHSNEIIKPWMNSILSEVMVDYLERAPNDEVVAKAVVRCADWLLTMLQEDDNGLYWPYEAAWGENEGPPYAARLPDQPVVKHPSGDVQLDYNARTLLWATRLTGDPRYARGWQATFERTYERLGSLKSSYGQVKVPENFSWHEAHLWNARWRPDGIDLDPVLDLLDVGRTAKLELPDGRTLTIERTSSGVTVVP